MKSYLRRIFLLLVSVQGLHSIEEYCGEIWTIFPPATVLCSLISSDLEVGFLVINIGLFLFGILSWLLLHKMPTALSRVVIWFWIVVEIINGVGHPIWSISEGGYTPGLMTAPILFIISLFLYRNLTQHDIKKHI